MLPNSNPSTNYPEERRIVTVLFADVQGFTPLAEQLDFEAVGELIKSIWNKLDKVIDSEGGYIDKHIGDAVMAVWGAPFAGDNDAERAVRAGLNLILAMDEFTKKSTIPGADTLKLRVGINTGPVFAGTIGMKNEYTVIGDTVNVANRLEQIAEANQVVISENTFRTVRANFKARRLEPTQVKGKVELIMPYAVEGIAAAQTRIHYQSIDSLETHLVGRSTEMATLKDYFQRSRASSAPVMALVTGEVGIGKSRLLMEFANELEENGEIVSAASGRALAQTSRVSFFLWRTLLRNLFGLRDEDSSDVSAEKFLLGIQQIWPTGAQITALEAAHVVGGLIGLTWPNSPFASDLNLSVEAHMNRVFSLTQEILRRLGARRSIILILDDLQWADRESLRLLLHLVEPGDKPLPMLVLGGARPELLLDQPLVRNVAQVLNLLPIPVDAQIVAEAYPALRGLPKDVLIEIASRAEGNPYFLEEIVKSLVKAGALETNNPDEIHNRLLTQIPESLRSTLQARLDNLSREARTVALLASVVGRVFWVGAIFAEARSKPTAGVTPMINIPPLVIERFVQDGLRQLVRAEMAFPRSGSKFNEEQEYIFKNSFLRDVAYAMIPVRNRAQYHKAVANWMSIRSDPTYQTMAVEHTEEAEKAAKGTGTLARNQA
jgi:class 3 adenylate cyclase